MFSKKEIDEIVEKGLKEQEELILRRKEKKRVSDKIYKEKHKKEIAVAKAKYYQANKKEILKQHAEYYQAHKQEISRFNKTDYKIRCMMRNEKKYNQFLKWYGGQLKKEEEKTVTLTTK